MNYGSAYRSDNLSEQFIASETNSQKNLYYLVNDDQIQKRNVSSVITNEDEEREKISLLHVVSAHFHAWLVSQGFTQIIYPNENSSSYDAHSAYGSPNWSTSSNLIVIAPTPGCKFGVWSLTLCIQKGLKWGTMRGFVDLVLQKGYGVIIFGECEQIGAYWQKQYQYHILQAWKYISSEIESKNVSFVSYFQSGLFLKKIIEHNLRQPVVQIQNLFLIHVLSSVLSFKDSKDLIVFFQSRALNWVFPSKNPLTKLQKRIGCKCIPIASPPDTQPNPAMSIEPASYSILRCLDMLSLKNLKEQVMIGYCQEFIQQEGLLYCIDSGVHPAEVRELCQDSQSIFPKKPNNMFGTSVDCCRSPNNDSNHIQLNLKGWILVDLMKKDCVRRKLNSSWFKEWLQSIGTFLRPSFLKSTSAQPFRKSSSTEGRTSEESENAHEYEMDSQVQTVTEEDFEFLHVVGKGAFGKVVLVKKKEGTNANQAFAMKILSKHGIARRGQIEHAKIEFRIFCAIRHPFICRLRYAFQNEETLFLVTDYYCGGSLFYHLRKAGKFSEVVVCFYMSEVLLAVEHLHSHQIIYRDLKLENVIMDKEGHLAITDFGLSKMHCDSAKTFCGTAEYMAPELVRGLEYGIGVDWWSFGIMLYELAVGKTPFLDKNRKYMFQKILKASPEFPRFCTSPLCSAIREFLTIEPAQRLGVRKSGSEEIKKTRFFRSMNFRDLLNRNLPAPFIPDVASDDVKYVPKVYLDMEATNSLDDTEFCDILEEDEFLEYQYAGTPVFKPKVF